MVSRGDVVMAVIWLVLALWVYSAASDLPTQPGRPTQPGQWPGILALLMAGLSAGLLVQLGLRWRASKKAPQAMPLDVEKPVSEAESPVLEEPAVTETARPVVFFLAVASLVAYIWLLPRLGFWLMTPLLLAGYMLLLGLRKPLWLLALTLGLAAAIVLVFSQLLAVPLPRGTGIFRNISYWFY